MAEIGKWLAVVGGDLLTAQRKADADWVSAMREFAAAFRESAGFAALARQLTPAQMVISDAESIIGFRFERQTDSALRVRAIVGFERRFAHTSSKQFAVRFQIKRVAANQHKERQNGK